MEHQYPKPYLFRDSGYNVDTQHDGTSHLAINNTFLRRTLIRLALHTTAKFYSREGLCIPILKTKILKRGRRIHLTEGATMKYLAEHTTIPVPKVYCSFLLKKRAYIVMEKVQGESLAIALENGMSDESAEAIFSQLRKMFAELRALKPPPGVGIESCVGGSLYDSRIPYGTPRFGPFKTTQDFHSWIRRGLKPEQISHRDKDQEYYDIQDMMSKQDGPWGPPCFTHGDLNPFNIIVHGGKVVAIIDWEFSGWYPHYWEYTSAWFGNIMQPEWQERLNRILDKPDPEVFKMEDVRHKWYGSN